MYLTFDLRSLKVPSHSSDFFISAQGLRTFSAGGGSTVTYVDGRGTITGGVRFGDMSFLDNFLAAQQYSKCDYHHPFAEC